MTAYVSDDAQGQTVLRILTVVVAVRDSEGAAVNLGGEVARRTDSGQPHTPSRSFAATA